MYEKFLRTFGETHPASQRGSLPLVLEMHEQHELTNFPLRINKESLYRHQIRYKYEIPERDIGEESRALELSAVLRKR